MHGFGFDCQYKDKITNARAGVIHTPHGDIETPAFVPVGTQATVKSLTPDELQDLDVNLFFVNTYHIYLRPEISVIKKFGGLHRFMGWDRPLITDSGGFQVFSLGRKKYGGTVQNKIPAQGRNDREEDTPTLVKISDDGVTFQSHWDGSTHVFTPESSMEYQWDLGADIHIAFDDCTPYPVTESQVKKSLERTHRWAERSLEEHQRLASLSSRENPPTGGDRSDPLDFARVRNDEGKPYQALYGSIQGSIFEELRKESAKFITSLPFDGFAIGGVSVGESKKEMVHVLDWVTPYLPDDKPRHMLGVGEIDDIFALVSHGMDTFDCVQPTRLARMGRVFTRQKERMFEIDITKKECSDDTKPIDDACQCYTCKHFSRAYLHHLFHVRELLGYRLATIHNIRFIQLLVKNIRHAIREGSFQTLEKQWVG